MELSLKRTKQCSYCPWRKDACVDDIPGYVHELHTKLEAFIAQPMDWFKPQGNQLKIMACHESTVGQDTHCIGWLVNQLGPGNNIPLRMAMWSYENIDEIETIGEQHQTFADTLPAGAYGEGLGPI